MSFCIHIIAGARPNFMKIAPLWHALSKEPWCTTKIIHTGQHYDASMSGSFFQDLNLPTPHHALNVGSGSHTEQTANIMMAYEEVCHDNRPDLVIVVGDVNSTIATALVAKKLGFCLAHLEAGLRSGDRTMPEEINRLATDAISDILWTPSADANENLLNEGVDKSKIDFVGNIMIDSFELQREAIEKHPLHELQFPRKSYATVTLHRPSNVDTIKPLTRIVDCLLEVADHIPLAFPIHPRTEKCLLKHGLMEKLSHKNIQTLPPLPYRAFMSLVNSSRLVITDSGGIQEETSYLGIPCLTLRENTERPITISQGTNKLVSIDGLLKQVRSSLAADSANKAPQIELWDGKTAERITEALKVRFLA
ncbi:non-hydrolyzing UDP-N-acetylglucosamine 2-epimerase [Kiloniella majae]|uniref:non-hydrolyzing UDP-N-acetylglucosamine 2-epimerase n=1 Tax=Kiloniella majae TaxID=1938558 RepID=UPI000A277EE5|nr:UDP-N-acetylglucosamine 2-epimerase (non-hydrolyzing) [Kiloniella majae]